MNWSAFEAAAPALAGAAKARFGATHVALLGTLRPDGSPRISPIEPYFTGGELLLGAMARSAKARDLVRDPRCVLHNSISDPNAGEPEFKLYGSVEQVAADAPSEAWWQSQPAGAALIFGLRVREAVRVEWQLERGEMRVTRWTVQRGLEETARRYP
jgi:pyridoxamine 5'-phosphate oxidase-like protein